MSPSGAKVAAMEPHSRCQRRAGRQHLLTRGRDHLHRLEGPPHPTRVFRHCWLDPGWAGEELVVVVVGGYYPLHREPVEMGSLRPGVVQSHLDQERHSP